MATARTLTAMIKKNIYYPNLNVLFPPPALCTDNGVMIGWAAIEKFNLGVSDIIVGQDVQPRWPIGPTIPEYGPQLESIIKKMKKCVS